MTKKDILCNLIYDIEKIECDHLLKIERIFLSSSLYLYIVSLNKFDIIYNNGLKFHGIPIYIVYSEENYFYSISIKHFSISEKELKE